MTEPDQLFRERMREVRERAPRMSQRQLAEELQKLGFEMSQPAIWAIESGKRNVSLAEAIAISAVLDVPTQDLYRELPSWDDYSLASAEEPGIGPELAWLHIWRQGRLRRDKQSTPKEEA
jgi:DNA-binding XRE family transcriptional regulator